MLGIGKSSWVLSGRCRRYKSLFWTILRLCRYTIDMHSSFETKTVSQYLATQPYPVVSTYTASAIWCLYGVRTFTVDEDWGAQAFDGIGYPVHVLSEYRCTVAMCSDSQLCIDQLHCSRLITLGSGLAISEITSYASLLKYPVLSYEGWLFAYWSFTSYCGLVWVITHSTRKRNQRLTV